MNDDAPAAGTIVDRHKPDVADLCREHQVRRLEVFGSAADGSFRPESSDIDFLVEFLPLGPGECYECYFGLLESLQKLFERRVDLVDVECLKNPYFIKGVNHSRKMVYDARSTDVPT